MSAVPILLVTIFATFLSFKAAQNAARNGRKVPGVFQAAFVGFCAWGLLAQGWQDHWPASVGWVVFISGALEALLTDKELPPFEIVPVVTSDPTVGSWPHLFCLKCNIQTKAKRTFPPAPQPPCPRCGGPLQG